MIITVRTSFMMELSSQSMVLDIQIPGELIKRFPMSWMSGTQTVPPNFDKNVPSPAYNFQILNSLCLQIHVSIAKVNWIESSDIASISCLLVLMSNYNMCLEWALMVRICEILDRYHTIQTTSSRLFGIVYSSSEPSQVLKMPFRVIFRWNGS